MHCHLLPGIDDGCQSIDGRYVITAQQTHAAGGDELFTFRGAGFVGSVCTPHTGPEPFPLNTPEYIRMMVEQTRRELADRGIDYPLWAGGEVRLHKRLVQWFEAQGVPTLGASRCVLVDFWDAKWPRWINPIFEWLMLQGYQPILAHPERLLATKKLDAQLQALLDIGVWFQGNFRCMTGEDGYHADQMIRRFLAEGRYHLLALDTHRPDCLPGRIDGMRMAEAQFGHDAIEQLASDAPRRVLAPAE